MTALEKIRVWLPMVLSIVALSMSLYGLRRPSVSGHSYGAVYTPNQLIGSQTWPATATNPTLTQAAQPSDIATNNIVIQSQAPFASAATNVTGGNIVLNVPAAVSGTANGQIQISTGGTTQFQFGQFPGSIGTGMLVAGGLTPSNTNYAFAVNSTSTTLNAVTAGTVNIDINAVPVESLTAGGITLAQPTALSGVATFSSGIKLKVRTNTSSASDNVLTSDYYVLVNKASAVTETLPAPAAGLHLCIKDASGNASTNNITVHDNAAENIDGATTKVLNANFEGLCVTSDGTNWYVTEQVATTIL